MDNSKYKLLVIDDEAGVRQSIVAYLEDSGFVVYDAADATTGLQLFKDTNPDLVITDLSMPNVDGLTLLGQVHDIQPATPIIMISGAGVVGDVVRALRLGATNYLVKPIVDLEILVHAVQKGLERSVLLLENQHYRLELEQANEELKNYVQILEQDQRAGHFVQQSMLPATPFYARDYVCEHKVIPSLYLSGDCIDYTFIKGRYHAFYLADVSGHGSASAFVTIWLKNLVAQLVRLKQLLDRFDSASTALVELVDVVNNEMLDMEVSNHLTLVIGVVDTRKNQLYYTVAGHLPLPILFHQGKAEFLPGKGKPIGLYQGAEWPVYQTQLPHESFSLLMFSDGILEILAPESLSDKEQALLALVEESAGKMSALTQYVDATPGDELPDDVAILSISKGY